MENEPVKIRNSLLLDEVSSFEVFRCIQNLKNKNTSSFNDIPLSAWKKVAEYIAEPISYLINESFICGTFPDCLKTSKIIPIFKTGQKTDPTNYRPISILHNISKIFEKIFLNRLLSFLEKYNILSANQHGFRKDYSTKTAVLKAIALIQAIKAEKKFQLPFLLT